MANWYGNARSNYFRVKDLAAFHKAFERLDITIYEGTGPEEGLVTILSEDEYGGWPSFYLPEENAEGEIVGEEDVEVDVAGLVAEHLAEGEVAILIEVGAEKLRYLTGMAVAINSSGERRAVDLEEIYDRAQELGPNVTIASY